jgi:hypothetical protein
MDALDADHTETLRPDGVVVEKGRADRFWKREALDKLE